jgi:hypothetical protein
MSCERCGVAWPELNYSVEFERRLCRDCFVTLQRGPSAIAPGELPESALPSSNGASGEPGEIESGEPDTAVEAIRRALLEDAQDTQDATGPAREEVPGAGGLLHRGVPVLFYGGHGTGKTSVVMTLALSAAAAGERVLYLDRENGPALSRERIRAILDANPEWGDPLAEGSFAGRHWAELDKRWQGSDFGEAIAGAGFSGVILDSAREHLRQVGLDPDRDDVTPLLDLAVSPLIRRGLWVAALDNVGHRERHRPKGSGSKLDALPQGYRVTTVEEFSPILSGRIKIVCQRSRYGDIGREWSMRLGGGLWELPSARSEAPDARSAREIAERREAFRRACIDALREDEPQGRNRLIAAARDRGAEGRTERLREWLAALAADPASGIVSARRGYALAALNTYGPEQAGHSGAIPPKGLRPGGRAIPRRGMPSGAIPGPDAGGRALEETWDFTEGAER